MVVLMLERVPASLRGEISRWMIEPRTGVFVGKLSGMVRDKLWEKAIKSARGGAGMLIYSSKTEQGFSIRTFGDISRETVNMEGLWLVRRATS
ncbi:MAG: type I-E CRISPR-associated endoribonuclease Cas2 [Armatimonadetes bacterium]|nr:type I-E CRISPR-associated endoribonuclease Cas2 [Armatimonadota bacterium]